MSASPNAVDSSGKVDPGKGGGIPIVAAREATGKGQASDISEKDPERIRVAKNSTNEAMIHICAIDGECVRGVRGGQGAKTSGSRATETFEARASELPRPPEDAAAEKAATEEASADKAAAGKTAAVKAAAEKAAAE